MVGGPFAGQIFLSQEPSGGSRRRSEHMTIRTLDMDQTVIGDLVNLLETDPEAFQHSAISGAMCRCSTGANRRPREYGGRESIPTASLSEPGERMLWQTTK